MVEFVRIISEKNNLKKPKKNEKNIFTLYSPKKEIIKKADTISIDTEISIKLPENSSAFLVTKFEDQEIIKIIGPAKKRLWITLLNESYLNNYQIKKGDEIGYLIIEPSTIKIHYETKQKIIQKTKCPINYLPKNWSKKWEDYFQKKKTRQTGGFLNRYDLAYTGRDTVNQIGKTAPKIITKATSDINEIAKDRIDQIVRTGGAEIERIAPKIIKGAIEEVYKTPFRLLGNLGKNSSNNINLFFFKRK